MERRRPGRRLPRGARPVGERDGVPGQERARGAQAGGRARRRAGRDEARPGRARHPGDRGDWRLLSLSGRPLRRRDRSTTPISSRSPGAGRDDNSVGLHTLDHLTHNVNRGRMDHWANFYERIFNFRQIRYFDIEGKQTALLSRAMTAPDDKIRIPLNESQDEHSQIEEYLKEYKGEGIQHLALRHRRHLRHRRQAARQRHPLPGQPRHLLRHDRQAPARATATTSRRCASAAS